jgi:hypothetical protein
MSHCHVSGATTHPWPGPRLLLFGIGGGDEPGLGAGGVLAWPRIAGPAGLLLLRRRPSSPAATPACCRASAAQRTEGLWCGWPGGQA